MGKAAAALARAFAEIKDRGVGSHLLGDAIAHSFEPALHARFADSARPQRFRRIDRVGEDMQPHRGRLGLGRTARELQRLLYDLLDAHFDLGKSVGIGDTIILDQPLAEHVDRVALNPGIDLLLCPIGADDGVTLVMADGAVGLGLNQGRAPSRARSLGRLLHRQPHCEDIIAIHRYARHAIGVCLGRDLGIKRDVLQRRCRRIKIVLADEYRRHMLHRRKIQRLVKIAVIGRAVAEEGDADVIRPALAGAHADSHGVPYTCGDDAVCSE